MATAFFRTVILYLLLIAGLRITGKRQIGELEPIELVLTMLLSDLASVPMQDFGIPLVNGIVPIVTLLSLSMLLSYGSLRSVRFRTLLCGEPTLIIRSGHILQEAMRRNRLTVDELLEALRGQGISDLRDVKYAVLETSGQLSVLPRADCQPVTPRQLSLQPEDPQTLPIVVISDGRLLRRSMERLGLDDGWLQARIRPVGALAGGPPGAGRSGGGLGRSPELSAYRGTPQHLRRGADAADPLPYPVRYRGLTGPAAGAGRAAMSAGCAGCAGAHQHSEYPVIIFR